jgi:hypothetical protein
MKIKFLHHSNSSGHRLAVPKHSFFHKIGRDATVDWLLMFAVGSFLSLLFVGVGYIKYINSKRIINSESNIQSPVNPIGFDDNRLDDLVSKFKTKNNDRARFNNGTLSIPNPGL